MLLNRTSTASIFILLACAAADLHAQTAAPAVQQPGILRDTMSADPLPVSRKFQVRVVQAFGIRGFLGSAVGAGIGQATNTPSEWGQGAEGFADRYASGFGNNLNRQVFAFTLESLLHEDPRYFPSTEKTTGARIKNVIRQILFTKTDKGSSRLAYGRLISAFGAAQLTNTWQPSSNSSVGDGIERGFIILGGDAAIDLMQEFIPFTRSNPFRHRH
jgi:hypothetical protein